MWQGATGDELLPEPCPGVPVVTSGHREDMVRGQRGRQQAGRDREAVMLAEAQV